MIIMQETKGWTSLLIALIITLSLSHLVSAAIISPSAIGANSQSYSNNYESIIAGSLLSKFNSTIQYTVGSTTYLTVPEYQSSTACLLNGSGLVTTYLGNAVNGSIYEVRSDAFSEAGIALSMSNRSNEFDAWVNFVEIMDICGYGNLPCWVVARNNSIGGNQVTLAGGQNDTAIDGDVRVGIALYLAANNTNFTSGNRTRYFQLAKNISRDVYIYDTISITTKATRAGVNVTRLPMGGGDCASGGLGCSTDMWVGYLGDIIKFFQYSYIFTGNATYDAAARNFTAATYSVSLDRDTDGDGFGVAPFNFNWNTTGTYLGIGGGGGVNTYHYDSTHEQWDDSDAPRFMNFCDILRVQNLSVGSLNGPYLNASAYCIAWSKASVYNATTTSLQYYYNGTCATNCNQTGYYPNGLGVGLSTFYNTSYLSAKVNESIGHYGWTGNTVDSTSCGTGVMFRAVKMTKGLGTAIGYDERWVAGSSSPSTPSCSQDYNGTDWNITTDTNITGEYCNIKDFIIQPGVTVNILPWNGTNATGWAKINATRMFIYGNITGDGAGYGGGSGGAGGGGDDPSSTSSGFHPSGNQGTGTNQNGSDGSRGPNNAGTGSGRSGSDGGSGGAGFNATNPGAGGTRGIFGSSDSTPGIVGVSAQANSDTSYADNASQGYGGGGGGGGGGGASQSGNNGGGGGGGGMGGDGGAALVLKATNVTLSGRINLRSGQNSCGDGTAGGDGTTNNGVGGNGASNTQNNCNQSQRGVGGNSIATHGDGSNGGSGGAGAGGAIAINATNTLNYSGSTIDVSGGESYNGGTVKLIYNTLVGVGDIIGASSTVVSPNYKIVVNLTNVVNKTRINRYVYELIGASNFTGVNPENNTIYTNNIGAYSLQLTFIQDGEYYDQNISFTLTSANITLNVTTYQATLNISARKLYFNSTIESYNLTNWLFFNATNDTYLLLPANNGSNNLHIAVTGNYSMNQTCNATTLTTTACDILGIYDNIFKINATLQDTGLALSNFTVQVTNALMGGNIANATTTNGSVYIRLLQGYSYTFAINESIYAFVNATLPANASTNVHTFTILPGTSFNITIYNESTNTRITQNVTVQFVTEGYAVNYTISGNSTISYLPAGDYSITYWLEPEIPRNYYVTLNPQSYQNIDLYIIDEDISQLYLPVVISESTVPINNVTVKLLRGYVVTNSTQVYIVVEMAKTDTNGKAVLRVVPNTIYYKLIITDGTHTLETTPTKFTSSTNTYTLNTKSNPITSLLDNQLIARSLTFDNSTLTYTFTWSDPGNIVTNGCLTIYKFKNGIQTTDINGCLAGSTGSLTHTVNDTNNTRYLAIASLPTNTEFSTLPGGSLDVDFASTYRSFGLVGFIIFAILFITFIFVGGETGIAGMAISGALAIMIAGGFGFLASSWSIISGVVIVVGIIVYRLGR